MSNWVCSSGFGSDEWPGVQAHSEYPSGPCFIETTLSLIQGMEAPFLFCNGTGLPRSSEGILQWLALRRHEGRAAIAAMPQQCSDEWQTWKYRLLSPYFPSEPGDVLPVA